MLLLVHFSFVCYGFLLFRLLFRCFMVSNLLTKKKWMSVSIARSYTHTNSVNFRNCLSFFHIWILSKYFVNETYAAHQKYGDACLLVISFTNRIFYRLECFFLYVSRNGALSCTPISFYSNVILAKVVQCGIVIWYIFILTGYTLQTQFACGYFVIRLDCAFVALFWIFPFHLFVTNVCPKCGVYNFLLAA